MREISSFTLASSWMGVGADALDDGREVVLLGNQQSLQHMDRFRLGGLGVGRHGERLLRAPPGRTAPACPNLPMFMRFTPLRHLDGCNCTVRISAEHSLRAAGAGSGVHVGRAHERVHAFALSPPACTRSASLPHALAQVVQLLVPLVQPPLQIQDADYSGQVDAFAGAVDQLQPIDVGLGVHARVALGALGRRQAPSARRRSVGTILPAPPPR